MFFKRNKKNELKCEMCASKVNSRYSFCPYCGNNLVNTEKELKDFGMLGKSDSVDTMQDPSAANFGLTDKLIGSLINNLVKNLDKQFKDVEKAEVKNFPNGIKIRIGSPSQNQPAKKSKILNRTLSSDQLKKMSELPRASAKSSVKRLSDKVIYELSTPGLDSTEDVFISKLELGYEIKAIGSKKIYVNSLPINLPLKKLSIINNKLLVEFKTEEAAEIF